MKKYKKFNCMMPKFHLNEYISEQVLLVYI